jgi:LmbE family N-acetylglucosaminyl deacetylase
MLYSLIAVMWSFVKLGLMNFHRSSATLTVPDRKSEETAWKRVTHLGIGAHADDLEFMALHGILACYNRDDAWFGGVTCTNGAGSARNAMLREDALIALRHAEQEEAAAIGQYSLIAQLGYSSAETKDIKNRHLTDDLATIFGKCRPQIVYTHNPADKHETHVAVVARTVSAIRSLPREQRPKRLLGCEVWRDLDWMDDRDKVTLDVSTHPELASRLASVYSSQLDGGKRYDLAVRGREKANATFLSSHSSDETSAVWFAMDLTPLIADDAMTISNLVKGYLTRFQKDVIEKIERFE